MSGSSDWMHRADAEILRYLDREHPNYVPLIASRLGMHLGYAETRCDVLAEQGLIEPISEEVVFRITERGERALRDEGSRRATGADEKARN